MGSRVMNCPNEYSHDNKLIWAFLEDDVDPDRITALNIRVNGYQLFFSFRSDTTELLNAKHDMIAHFDHILDFTLDEDTINRKIKTILTFM
jgi:hypothetical protein